MPLELLAPAMLGLLGLLAPLVVLYILKIRRQRVTVASTWLWREARRDLMARSPFKKLQLQIPLIVQALALIAIAVAAARPATRSQAIDGDHVAIIIDTSASMSAESGTTTRIALAKRAAHELVAGLPPGSDAMIVDAGRDARIALAPDRDTRRMAAAIDALAARDVEGNLGAAISLAVGRMEQLAGDKRIVIISDDNIAREVPTPSGSVGVDVVVVGERIDNSAIVRVDVRAGTGPIDDTPEVQAFLLVANYGAMAVEKYVTMRQHNASDVLASRKVVVGPGEKVPVVLTFSPSEGDHGTGLLFDIAPHDAMPVDDVAFGRVPAGRKLQIYVASAGDPPASLVRALWSDPDAEVRAGTIDELRDKTDIARDALVVVHGACMADAPGGDLLIVDPPAGPCLGAQLGERVEHPVVTSWSDADPRLRFVSMHDVLLMDARPIEPESKRQALIRSDRGVIAADVSTTARAATLLGFDIDRTTWPTERSFVVFVRNVIEQARVHRASAIAGPALAGDPLRVSLPSQVREANIEAPDGAVNVVQVRQGLAVVPEMPRAGLYRIAWQTPVAGQLWMPVNLTSPDESDLSRAPPALTRAATHIADADELLAHRSWTWLLALAALGLVLFDVWYLTRRRAERRRSSVVLWGASLLAALLGAYVVLVWFRLLPEAYLRFARPVCVLLALPAMLFVMLRLGGIALKTSAVRRVLGELLLSAAVLGCALAAAEPELGRPLDRLTVIAVVDRSRSIDLVVHATTRIERELSFAQTDMRDDDLIAKVVFGAHAATEDPPRPSSELAAPQQVDIARDGTDLGAAIAHALAEVPADSAGRLVLLSDGVATRGDAMAAAAAAVASEIPIDVVALEQREIPDVRVVSFRTAPRANEGETLGMRVVIASPQDADVELRLSRDGQLVQRLRARVAAGEDVVSFPEPAGGTGLHRYDVEVTALDPSLDEAADDNTMSTFVRVRGPARALVVDGDPAGTTFVAGALTAAGFSVVEGGVSAVPGDIAAMAAYDLIIFGDVAAHDLSTGQIDSLASYVRDLGGGLLLTGGDDSFGPGGYGRSPLEEVSPVSFDLKQDQRRASLAEIIAIDISGSMGMNVGGHTKLELANEAAARSADLLGAGDQIGVVHVDTAPRWAVPLAPVSDIAAIKDAIRAVGPGGGGIYVDVALKEAYAALAPAKVNLKHVLLFADGADAENITPAIGAMVDHAAKVSGITLSCVSLGRGGDSAALEDLSLRGGGRFYIVEDATKLPAVFTQETVLASRSALVEEPFVPALGVSHPTIAGVDIGAAPALRGYVVTIPKPRSSVVLSGPDGDPILAIWSAGLGKSAAFTSDLKDRWGSAWTRWEGASQLVVQTARDIARREDDSRVRLEADASAGQLHVRATVTNDDGRMETFRRLRVSVSGPDGFKRDLSLDAAGAGTYTATVPLSHPGAYIAVARDELGGNAVATSGAVLTAGDELRPTGTDHAVLNRIAELTGGKRRDTLAGIFRDRAVKRFAYEDITTPLLWLAAFALLLAVAARRLAFPDARSPWAALKAHIHRPAASPPAGDPTATLEQLLAAKQGERAARPARRPEARARDEAPTPAPSHVDLPTAATPPPAPSATPATPPSDGARPLSAVEILLARRKNKRR
jgi:uncharacterized membrane protein